MSYVSCVYAKKVVLGKFISGRVSFFCTKKGHVRPQSSKRHQHFQQKTLLFEELYAYKCWYYVKQRTFECMTPPATLLFP